MSDLAKAIMDTIPDLDALLKALNERPASVLGTGLRSLGITDARESIPDAAVDQQAEQARVVELMKAAILTIQAKHEKATFTPEQERAAKLAYWLVGRPVLLVQNGDFGAAPAN